MFSKDFQIGFEGYCYQQSTYGYLKHQSGAALHEQTIGIGGEEFTISRNQRDIVDGALNLLTGNSTWSRSFLVTGGYLGLQLGLEVGLDYHLPLTKNGEWTPGVGVHKQENAPPSAFNSMNFWFSLGP